MFAYFRFILIWPENCNLAMYKGLKSQQIRVLHDNWDQGESSLNFEDNMRTLGVPGCSLGTIMFLKN